MDGHAAAALLGVSEQADPAVLLSAFRARAKVTHPDQGGDARAFDATLRAFRALVAQRPRSSSDVSCFGASCFGASCFGASWLGAIGSVPRLEPFDRYDSARLAKRAARSSGSSFEDVLRVALAREASRA